MKILYYSWREFTRLDAQDALRALGHTVDVVEYEWKSITRDDDFEAMLVGKLRALPDGTRPYACVFSFNFFPMVSKACQETGVPYICMVFDSPHLPLNSIHINHPVNHVYIFDKQLLALMREKGATTLQYATLAVDAPRLSERSEIYRHEPWMHDVAFVGTLYNDEFDFYDQITTLPPALQGHFDGVIEASRHIFGYDLIGDPDVITPGQITEMHRYVNFALSDQYRMDEDLILRDILRRKVTKVERPALLEDLARHFSVALYTREGQPVPEGVEDCGFAEYRNQMPRIFHRTKINLNITLRTILSGISLRALDVMGAGGFLLSTYQEELAEHFTDGEELVLAYTPEDLREKTAYYLTHEDERERIAAAGQKKVLEKYNYTRFFERILSESLKSS